jgi:threonine dehydrogenase-like Zn-dependent dehydrogenase
MKNLVYYLDAPGRDFRPVEEEIGEPGPGEIRLRTLRTSVCQSDVVIWSQGLPRIKTWPAVLLHEASCLVDAVGEGVTKFKAGDLVGLGCDIPCGDRACVHCGDGGTGDWTSCPNTQATGHEFPGFARRYAILPGWFVELGPIVRFDASVGPDLACHLEPLACNLEGMTRVNGCVERRIVVLIGAGSQSCYALQAARAMGARRIIVVNRGRERLERVLRDFGGPDLVGIPWEADAAERIRAACAPFKEPHFVMVNASAEPAYRLATELMGYGTVLDAHAGVKGAGGKPSILHEVDLNKDIHYKLQCFQATHGSSMRGIELARDFIAGGRMPLLGRMTDATERFSHARILEAVRRAGDRDSLKVIIEWSDAT